MSCKHSLYPHNELDDGYVLFTEEIKAGEHYSLACSYMKTHVLRF